MRARHRSKGGSLLTTTGPADHANEVARRVEDLPGPVSARTHDRRAGSSMNSWAPSGATRLAIAANAVFVLLMRGIRGRVVRRLFSSPASLYANCTVR